LAWRRLIKHGFLKVDTETMTALVFLWTSVISHPRAQSNNILKTFVFGKSVNSY